MKMKTNILSRPTAEKQTAHSADKCRDTGVDLFAWVEGRQGRPDSRDPAPFRTPMLAHAIDEADFAALAAPAARLRYLGG